MQIQTIASALFIAGSLNLSTAALATTSDMIIHNNTDFPSTCVINNGICSNFLPNNVGITAPHSTNSVPGVTVYSACWADRANCTAVIYMTPDCSGPSIGTIVLDTKTGIKDVIPNGDYSISASGFEVTLG